jgi:TRAP transporter TAXI family solute receptor
MRIYLASAALVLGLFASSPLQAQNSNPASDAWSMNPVLAGACRACPWGALGDLVARQMEFYGYEVTVCGNCNLSNGPRLVADRALPPPLNQRNFDLGVTELVTRPPDFGITNVETLRDAYVGEGSYEGQAKPGLRLIAMIETPSYIVAAAKCELGITDLAQLTGRPNLKIMGSSGGSNVPILEHYGLERATVEANGGEFLPQGEIEKRDDFDVIIHTATLGNYPEGNVWYEMTQRHDLCFLSLPEEVLDRYVNEYHYERAILPISYFRGLDRDIPTVSRLGNAVFGTADMPDSFAYDVAKAINEHRDLLKYGIMPFVYDSRSVWQMRDVPLHPGAEQYYREVGYIQ